MNDLKSLQRHGWALAIFLAMAVVGPACASGRVHWKLVYQHVPSPSNIFFTSAGHGVLTGEWLRRGEAAIEWTRDGGRRWHSAKIPVAAKKANFTGLWFSRKKLGWASGLIQSRSTRSQDKFILLQTRDGGRVWQVQASPPGLRAHTIWFGPGGKHGRLVPWSGRKFYQTTDGGRTWQTVSVGHQFGPAAWIGSWNHMVLGGQHGAVLISTNAGKKWVKIATGLKGPAAGLAAISFTDGGQVGWAVGGEGKTLRNGNWTQPAQPVILHTLDGGKIWAAETPPAGTTGFLTAVWAISAREAWVSSYLGYATANPAGAMPWILHTTNGGLTWHNTLQHVVSIHQLFFLDARHGWASGGQGGSPYEPLAAAVLIYHGR